MASITASGLGSGLDVNSIVTQLMNIEKQPLLKLQSREGTITAQISAYGQVKSALSKLEEAAAKLAKSEIFSATKASADNAEALTVSSKDYAQTGIYDVEVINLAKNQRVTTSATTAPTITAGDLTFSFNGAPAVNVTLTDGMTLTQARDAINAAFSSRGLTSPGVSAQVINNGTAEQLVFSATQTGLAGKFSISGTGGATQFAFDPDAVPDPGAAVSTVQTAQDALFKVNNISVTRSSNTVSDVIDGVTLSLKKAGTTTQVTVDRDDSVAKKGIEDFVKAYNDVLSQVKTKSAYDPETKIKGTLNGDSNMRSIKDSLRNIMSARMPRGELLLSDIGVSFKSDGTLSFTASRYDQMASKPNVDIAGLFGSKLSDPLHKGISSKIVDQVKQFLSPSGMIETKTNAFNDHIKRLKTQQDSMQYMLDKKQAALVQRYADLDISMSNLQSRSSYLSAFTMPMQQ